MLDDINTADRHLIYDVLSAEACKYRRNAEDTKCSDPERFQYLAVRLDHLAFRVKADK